MRLRRVGSSFFSIIQRPYPSSIGNGSENCFGAVHTKSSLYASIKSTNKKTRRKRKPKHLRNQKTKNSIGNDVRGKRTGRSVSEDELHSHLDSKLNYGKGGPIGPRTRNRGIIETKSGVSDDKANDISDRQREQQFFLRQLNNRPTLVLNANYVVSYIRKSLQLSQ